MYALIYGSLIIIVPGLIFAIYAQYKVKSTFDKFSKEETEARVTSDQVAYRLLSQNNCHSVMVSRTPGHLTDNYNPTTHVLSLSDSTYGKSNVSAVGVAAHECGHAQQHCEDSRLIELRTALVPITNYGSRMAVPIAIVGLILEILIGGIGANLGTYILALGVILYSLSTIFALITIPVEVDASRRAVAMLKNTGLYTKEDLDGIKKVLYAAALTYVASLVISFLYLLRFIIVLSKFRDRD